MANCQEEKIILPRLCLKWNRWKYPSAINTSFPCTSSANAGFSGLQEYLETHHLSFAGLLFNVRSFWTLAAPPSRSSFFIPHVQQIFYFRGSQGADFLFHPGIVSLINLVKHRMWPWLGSNTTENLRFPSDSTRAWYKASFTASFELWIQWSICEKQVLCALENSVT